MVFTTMEERVVKHASPTTGILNSLKEKVMKAILLTILMVLSFTVHADYINLTGAKILAQGMCEDSKKVVMCAVLEFKGENYVAMVDEKGEYKIFIIKDDKPELIWSRDSV